MSLSNTPVDTNRGTDYVSKILPKEVSGEIWAKTLENSAIMQLARQIQIPGTGITVPLITGDATADWVGETCEKPVSQASIDGKQLQPYKIAVIELFSNEFKRDAGAVYNQLIERLPYSIAKKFDGTVFNGTAPGSNFDVLTNSTAVQIDDTSGSKTVYKNLVDALGTVTGYDYEINGWCMSPKADPLLLGTVDGNGRPLFIANPEEGAIGNILGAPVYRSRGVYAQGSAAGSTKDTLGFAGDWTQAVWGMVDNINISFSEEASINDGTNTIHLWQRNMFACRVEAELAFGVADANAFVKLTGAATGA